MFSETLVQHLPCIGFSVVAGETPFACSAPKVLRLGVSGNASGIFAFSACVWVYYSAVLVFGRGFLLGLMGVNSFAKCIVFASVRASRCPIFMC